MREPHLMVDLETMGQGHDAAITQIGAVVFDAEGRIHDEFEAHVLLKSSIDAGLKVDAPTLQWWMEQEGEARKAFVEGQRTAMPLDDALSKLGTFCTRTKEFVGVWSHGATFDLPILNTAYRAVGRRMPWSFRWARDARTLFWLVAPFDPWQEDGVPGEAKHRALDDARRQARAVARAITHIRLHGLMP